jgi:hypothetical protein
MKGGASTIGRRLGARWGSFQGKARTAGSWSTADIGTSKGDPAFGGGTVNGWPCATGPEDVAETVDFLFFG